MGKVFRRLEGPDRPMHNCIRAIRSGRAYHIIHISDPGSKSRSVCYVPWSISFSTLVAIPDVKWFLNYSLPICVYNAYWKINEKIHIKYVAYHICFKPHILLDKNVYKITFFDLSVTSRRFLLMGIFDSELCVQSLWEDSAVCINWTHWTFSDQMRVVGCRLALVLLFACKVGCIIAFVKFVLCISPNMSAWQITSSLFIYLFILYLFISVRILWPLYLKNRSNNHLEISLALSGIDNLPFSAWSLNHYMS